MSNQYFNETTHYIDYFRSEHEKIGALESRLHKKILAVTMISALAEGRFPELQSDRLKFVRLVDEHSNWPHAKSISIWHMHCMIDHHGAAKLKLSSSFATNVKDVFAQSQKNQNPSLTIDLSTERPISKLRLGNLSRDEERFVVAAQHSNLLYSYRCKLVHEFRSPGYGFEFGEEDNQPVYRHQELVYPTNCILSLIPPILDTLQNHYINKKANPMSSYSFGLPWL